MVSGWLLCGSGNGAAKAAALRHRDNTLMTLMGIDD
jgi:hypothetical protein